MAEPLSIAVRAVHRARIQTGEKVVVTGAGPIGQCVALLARDHKLHFMAVEAINHWGVEWVQISVKRRV